MFRPKRVRAMTSNPNRKSHFTYLLLVILITIVIIAIIIMHTQTHKLVWHKDREHLLRLLLFASVLVVVVVAVAVVVDASCCFVSEWNAIMKHIPFSSGCRYLFVLYYFFIVHGSRWCTHDSSNDEKCYMLELYAV